MNLISLIFKGIFLRKSKLLFPSIAVAVGVASVIITSSIGAVGSQLVEREIKGMGFGSLMISPASYQTTLSEDELEIIKNTPCISSATAVIYTESTIESRKGQTSCILWGVDGGFNDIMNIKLSFGRSITPDDIYCENKVCLVDAQYAREIYSRENIVGKQIKVSLEGRVEDFIVVGVVDSEYSLVKNIASNYIPMFVYIPNTFLRSNTGETLYSSIAVNINNNITTQQAEKIILSSLRENPYNLGSYSIENMLKYSSAIKNILSIITVILSSIAAVSLLVSGISIMTVMTFSVTERTREIGIKKSVGAGFFNIVFEFLLEGSVISITGAIFGVVFAVCFILVGCRLLSIASAFDANMVMLSVVAATIMGIVFSIYPAMRAARLDPAMALRRN